MADIYQAVKFKCEHRQQATKERNCLDVVSLKIQASFYKMYSLAENTTSGRVKNADWAKVCAADVQTT